MEKESISSKMVQFMKELGIKEKERDGVSINMLMEVNIQVNIELDKEKELACMSTSIKKSIREIGRKIRKMDMA
jgi:hypothetical protein